MISPFFHCNDLIHLRDGFVRQLLHFFRQNAAIILTDEAVLLQLFQRVHTVTTNMTGSDTTLLSILVRDLDQFLAALFVQFRQRNAQRRAIGDGIETEAGIANCAFHSAHHALVPDGNRKHTRFGNSDIGNLIDRHGRAIGLDHDRLQQAC